jgi:hypothetical protein
MQLVPNVTKRSANVLGTERQQTERNAGEDAGEE